MCTSVASTALQNYPSLHVQAQQVTERFKKAFVLFSKCHNIYDKTYVDGDDLEELCEFHTSVTVHNKLIIAITFKFIVLWLQLIA